MLALELHNAFHHAADQMRGGNPHDATTTILAACLTGHVCANPDHPCARTFGRTLGMVAIGANVCARTVRRMAGDSSPTRPPSGGEFFALQVRSVESNRVVSFDDVFATASGTTALRCVGAGLNHDQDALAAVVKTYLDTHGPHGLFHVVADLVALYLMFEHGYVKDD